MRLAVSESPDELSQLHARWVAALLIMHESQRVVAREWRIATILSRAHVELSTSIVNRHSPWASTRYVVSGYQSLSNMRLCI